MITPKTSGARENVFVMQKVFESTPCSDRARSAGLFAIAHAIIYLADVMYKNGRHLE